MASETLTITSALNRIDFIAHLYCTLRLPHQGSEWKVEMDFALRGSASRSSGTRPLAIISLFSSHGLFLSSRFFRASKCHGSRLHAALTTASSALTRSNIGRPVAAGTRKPLNPTTCGIFAQVRLQPCGLRLSIKVPAGFTLARSFLRKQ